MGPAIGGSIRYSLPLCTGTIYMSMNLPIIYFKQSIYVFVIIYISIKIPKPHVDIEEEEAGEEGEGEVEGEGEGEEEAIFYETPVDTNNENN